MTEAIRPEDDLGFAGKVAIVTGGGAPDDGIGNGRAAAMLLARSGAKVLVVDIERELRRADGQDDRGRGRGCRAVRRRRRR